MGRPRKTVGEIIDAEPVKPAAEKKTGTAVSTQRTNSPAHIQPQGDSLLAVIARAATDPAVDMDKMERLLAMKERVDALEARKAFDIAFAEMQPNMPTIGKRGEIKIADKNDKTKIIQSTPYALWDDINKAIKPILSQHGFALSFRNGREGDQVIVTAVLAHKLGHREETTVRVPIDVSGSKNNAQGVGSSTSYGKRYAAGSILNITFEGEDDDAESTAPTAEEREAARRDKTDTRLGKLADKTAPKHDEDGVITEDQKPAENAAGGAKKERAAKGTENDAQPAGDDAAAPKSPNPEEVDYETFRAHFVEVLKKCENPRHINGVWKRDVLGWGDPAKYLFPPDAANLRQLFEARKSELAGGGKA